MSTFQAPIDGLTFDQAHGMIEKIQAEVAALDVTMAEINARYLEEWTPCNERKTKLMSTWQALWELLPLLSSFPIVGTATADQAPPTVEATATFEKKPRTSPRSIMLEELRNAVGPVSAEDLWLAVKRTGLQTKMKGPELVYQTLYAARKKGHYPIDRNEDGSWHWIREATA